MFLKKKIECVEFVLVTNVNFPIIETPKIWLNDFFPNTVTYTTPKNYYKIMWGGWVIRYFFKRKKPLHLFSVPHLTKNSSYVTYKYPHIFFPVQVPTRREIFAKNSSIRPWKEMQSDDQWKNWVLALEILRVDMWICVHIYRDRY